jgi:hypothetical protein
MSVVLCNSRRPVGFRYAPFATEDALRGNMSRRANCGSRTFTSCQKKSRQGGFSNQIR